MTKKATIEIVNGKGIEVFTVPVISETTKGLYCRIGLKDSPAKEWFAWSSPRCRVLSTEGVVR